MSTYNSLFSTTVRHKNILYLVFVFRKCC